MASISVDIIDRVLTSLETELNDSLVLFEKHRQSPEEINQRQDARKGIIIMYDTGESSEVMVADRRANMGKIMYAIDINIHRAYRYDKANRGEDILYQFRDKIIDWARDSLDVANLTGGHIYTFSFVSASANVRYDRFVNKILYFEAIRDLNKQQFTP